MPKLSRYQHVIHPGLTYLYLSIRALLQKSLEEEVKKKERAKSSGGSFLGQSKDQKYLQTGTVVHLLGQCSPVLAYPKLRVQQLFTRPSDTTRLLARLVRPGHPLGHDLPTRHSGPLGPVRRTIGRAQYGACEKKNIHRYRYR